MSHLWLHGRLTTRCVKWVFQLPNWIDKTFGYRMSWLKKVIAELSSTRHSLSVLYMANHINSREGLYWGKKIEREKSSCHLTRFSMSGWCFIYKLSILLVLLVSFNLKKDQTPENPFNRNYCIIVFWVQRSLLTCKTVPQGVYKTLMASTSVHLLNKFGLEYWQW